MATGSPTFHGSPAPLPHDFVVPLIIHWEEGGDMPAAIQEGSELGDLFRVDFRYAETRHFYIPMGPKAYRQRVLTARITKFMEKLQVHADSGQRCLGIVYYGGRGVDADQNAHAVGGGSIWASHRCNGGPSTDHVNWSQVQPLLESHNVDILLLLDCCYAGQTARAGPTSRFMPKNVELLAACGRLGRIPAQPGPRSFTSNLINILRHGILEAADGGRPIIVSDVHNSLVECIQDHVDSPFHISRPSTYDSIHLMPQPRPHRRRCGPCLIYRSADD